MRQRVAQPLPVGVCVAAQHLRLLPPRPIDHERRQPVHMAHPGGQLERPQDIFHRIMVITAGAVGAFRLAGGDHRTPVFARQRIAAHAAGEAARQHAIQPFLQQRRAAVGIQRVLKHDDLMLTQQLLFVMNIDKKIRVVRVEIVHGDMFQLLRRSKQNPVRHRVMGFRMGIQQQDLGRLRHHSPPKRRQGSGFPLPCIAKTKTARGARSVTLMII